ncbi:MAG TPA: hypothetical protein VGQ08_15780 [Nitrospiraceae bacterium]|jgi:hypothetical protein|nr:hypothetical protein [Nitrospiraceae bacterium]
MKTKVPKPKLRTGARPYKPTGDRLKKLASSFDLRRYNAQVNFRFPGDDAAWDISEIMGREDPDLADSPDDYSGGILGKTDRLQGGRGAAFAKFRLRHWTRRQLYNRRKWLKGELSRLILKQPSRGLDRVKPIRSQEERLTLILKRRAQIDMYTAALTFYKPLHDEVRKLRKVKALRKVRQTKKKALRKLELVNALAATRQDAGLAPLPVKEPQRRPAKGREDEVPPTPLTPDQLKELGEALQQWREKRRLL